MKYKEETKAAVLLRTEKPKLKFKSRRRCLYIKKKQSIQEMGGEPRLATDVR